MTHLIDEATHFRARRSRHQLRPGRRFKSISLVGAVALGVSLLTALNSNDVPAYADPAVAISDSMDRSVAAGWGSAGVGGTYAVNPATAFSVGAGQGVMTLGSGQAALATLPALGSDAAVVNLSVATVPAAGGGLYSSVRLRETNGFNYAARLRFFPGGAVALSVVREDGSPSALASLGTAVQLPALAAAKIPITVEFQVSGADPVSLRARAYPKGAVKPDWQMSITDSSAARLRSPGATSIWSYISGDTEKNSVAVDDLTAWSGITFTANGAPTATTPPTTTTTTPPPTTTTTPAPAPAPAPAPTVPAVPAGNTGSANPGATQYPIPSGALFVATNGSDTNAGTQAAPFRTVAAAISKSQVNSTIVVRAGSYHESLTVPDSRSGLTVQAYPGEAVWFEGSSVVTGWKTSGSSWVREGWTTKFDSSASYTRGKNEAAFIQAGFPMAAHPDQVWIDGVALVQVQSAAQVSAGKFWVDYATNKLYVGSNPNGHEVRASDLIRAFVSNAGKTTLRGIGVRRYAPSVPDMGAVRISGVNSVIENVISSDNSTTGFSVGNGSGITLRNITSQRNGMLGVHANQTDNFKVVGALVASNNQEQFNRTPVAGGIKVTRSRGVTIDSSFVTANIGTGVWLDESVYDSKVLNSRITSNTYYGVEAELSSKILIAGNLVARNKNRGIFTFNTSDVQIWNNTLVGNWRQYNGYQDSRNPNATTVGRDPRQAFPDPTMTWMLGPIVFKNNVVVSEGGDDYLFMIEDGTKARSTAQIGLSANSNVYQPGSAKVAMLTTGPGVTSYSTLDAYKKYGQESLSVQLNSGTVTSALAPSTAVSQLEGTVATPLPANIASLLGKTSGSKHLGAWISN